MKEMAKDKADGQVSRSDLFSSLNNKMSHPEFETALKELQDEMSIYSTDNS